MSVSLRRVGSLFVAGLTLLAFTTTATAQRPVPLTSTTPTVNPAMAANAGYNAGLVQGYTTGAAAAPRVVNNYALSTTPVGLGAGYGAGSLGTSPYAGYGLSTALGLNPFGMGGYGYPGWGNYIQSPYAGYLQGVAANTLAEGEWYNQIQQARLTREQSRQMAIDTKKKQIQFEAWYESMKLTAPQMKSRELATNLQEARRAVSTDIWSGKALNELLRSILADTAKLDKGPNLKLGEDTLKHINLTVAGKGGDMGLLKNDGKLEWPLPLEDKLFDDERKNLSKSVKQAVDKLKEGKKVEAATLNNIRTDFKKMETTLEDKADEFSPSQYIEASRYLKKVKDAIKALEDPKAANYFNNTWNAKGDTVLLLVKHLKKEGLQFAPAAPGDEAAYNSLYQSLRAFESRILKSANE